VGLRPPFIMSGRSSLFVVASASAAKLYCPTADDFQFDGGALWDSKRNGWAITGNGGVHGLQSFDLSDGYVEFEMDSTAASVGMNTNVYTISPDHAYTSYDDYCDGQGPFASSPHGTFCTEMDLIEANGGCAAQSTWHTKFDLDGDCDRAGCGAGFAWTKGRIRARFDAEGMHLTVDGISLDDKYTPMPSAESKRNLTSTMQTVGVNFHSTQWHGWVPAREQCGDQGYNASSTFSVSNVRIFGSVIFGPEPAECGAPSPPPAPHKMYCLQETDFTGDASWNGNAWTVRGNGGVHGLQSFNLLHGFVEFHMDSTNATLGMNGNFYTSSPDHAYTSYDDYCDGQGPAASSPHGTYCMEMDVIEANGGCSAATTWHTSFNKNGGCDQYGCQAQYEWSKGLVRAEFDDHGMTVYIGGKRVDSYSPSPFYQDPADYVSEVMTTLGVQFHSTQWHGWVPGQCGDEGYNPDSSFTIRDVKVYGSVIFGDEPAECPLARELMV